MADDLKRRAFLLYQRALECEDSERDTFVSQAAASDSKLREAVMELLDAADAAEREDFLGTPAAANLKLLGDTYPSAASDDSNELPRQFGRYELLSLLGKGGFGSVYLAQQTEPVSRQVAVKVIRNGLSNDSFARRFATERQALAMLNHPYVAQVFDAGAGPNGEPFLAMELVDGCPITEYCEREELSLRPLLQLFIKVCEAIQHAHQKSIIHRDIKPANVLVCVQNGRAVPKVIDFGIAKALDLKISEATLAATGTGLLGSPSYMSPEQIEKSDLDVDTRSDVYGLGVLLYELLTGNPPFVVEGEGVVTLLNKILEVEPARPSTVASDPAGLAADLDWILLKALEKDRDRRYESAAALAADLRRFLNDEPVAARPPTLAYRATKFLKRNTAISIASALVVVILVAGVVGTSLGFWSARQEAQNARRAEARAIEQSVTAQQTIDLLLQFLSSADPGERGRELKVVELLEAFEPQLQELEQRPILQASLMYTYGKTLFGLGLFDEAATFAESALELRETNLGPGHRSTIESKILWVDVLRETGEFDEAAIQGNAVLDQARTSLGEEDVLAFSASTALAYVMREQGRFEDAELLHRETLERQIAVLGENHPDTLQSMIRLGGALMFQHKMEEAEDINRTVLERRESVLGADHPDTLVARNELAFVLAESGKLEEGLALHRLNTDKRRAVLGPEHPRTLTSMANTAWVLGELGQFEEAESITRQVWETELRVLGTDHPAPLVTQGNLARTLGRLGRTNEAEALHREVLQKRRQMLGLEHPATLSGMHDLAINLARQKRWQEAATLFESVAEGRTSALGPQHPNTLRAMDNLAVALQNLDNLPRALDVTRDTLTLREKHSGKRDDRTLETLERLIALLDRSGAEQEAASLAKELQSRRQAKID